VNPTPVSPPAGPSSWRAGLLQAWRLAQPFWRDPAERGAWWQLGLVIGLTLATVAINVRLNLWNNAFFDTLQAHDLKGFWRQVGVFCGLALVFIVVAVYRMVLQQKLLMRWRSGLTASLLTLWLQRGAAYRLQLDGRRTPDNPDQRVADDARSFVDSTLSLLIGLINATVTLVSFVGILWTLSGSLPIGHWHLPGYMVWVAIVYSLLGTWLAQVVGRPLISTNAQQQRVEADFRYQLVQVRDHAEAIALARGEPAEQRRLSDLFDAVRGNWALLIRNTKRLTWFSAGYGQLASIFPLLAAAPRYFSGAIQLGGLTQTAQAFGQVQGALSWFVDAYGDLAEWRATVWRLSSFVDALEADPNPAASPHGAAIAAAEAHEPLTVQALGVGPGPGTPLLQVPSMSVRPGERLLVTGASGAGKSSLLRALAGLVAPLSGAASVPADAMFVPQRPYLPAGSLAEIVSYPQARSEFSDEALRHSLTLAGLAALGPRLDEAAPWARTLSPGEQQRLQFARLFLHRPRWMLLDEVTSALDENSERTLYQALHAELPQAGVISIGHRPSLRALHDGEITIHGGELRPVPQLAAA